MIIIIKFLTNEQRKQIGFDFLLNELEILSPYGEIEKRNLKPFTQDLALSLNKVLTNLSKIKEKLDGYKKFLRQLERQLMKLKNIHGCISKLTSDSDYTLDDVELFEIKSFALITNTIYEIIDNLNLGLIDINFNELTNVVKLLNPEKEVLPTFHIYDKYSLILKNIRKEKRNLEKLIVLEKDNSKIETLREKRLEQVVLEENEEYNIRRYLTEKLIEYQPILIENMKSIGKLDFLIAKGKIALKYNGIKPNITSNNAIVLNEMINPEIDEILRKKGNHFQPNSIELKEGVSIITGANMGGKSVTLKTTLLNLVLGHFGFFVYAKDASFPMLDFIYYISEDMQSISRGLSTFGGEIIAIKEVLSSMDNQNGFVALDEFARGTNPYEGQCIVKALCKYLTPSKSFTLLATHFDDIENDKTTHFQVVGLKNIDFNVLQKRINLDNESSIDIIDEFMDYRLEKVTQNNKVPKDALNICSLLGLDKKIIDIANNFFEAK